MRAACVPSATACMTIQLDLFYLGQWPTLKNWRSEEMTMSEGDERCAGSLAFAQDGARYGWPLSQWRACGLLALLLRNTGRLDGAAVGDCPAVGGGLGCW